MLIPSEEQVYPAPMHSYDALTLFFEEMRVGGILEGLQLVSIARSNTPGYPRGHIVTYYQPSTGYTHSFNTAEFVNEQRLAPDETPLTYLDAIQRLRHMMADAVKWGKNHATTSAHSR